MDRAAEQENVAEPGHPRSDPVSPTLAVRRDWSTGGRCQTAASSARRLLIIAALDSCVVRPATSLRGLPILAPTCSIFASTQRSIYRTDSAQTRTDCCLHMYQRMCKCAAASRVPLGITQFHLRSTRPTRRDAGARTAEQSELGNSIQSLRHASGYRLMRAELALHRTFLWPWGPLQPNNFLCILGMRICNSTFE